VQATVDRQTAAITLMQAIGGSWHGLQVNAATAAR